MKLDWHLTSRQAVRTALSLRHSARKTFAEPISIYDFVESLNIELRFIDIPSMEGMYSKTGGPVILINSLRPPGRKAFTCAHELGHHVFHHGTRVDELGNGQPRRSPEEFLADTFAGFLLMPKVAILREFGLRRWDVMVPAPQQAYTIAGCFGVGYGTLLFHMYRSLELISESTYEELSNVKLKEIRATLIGEECNESLLIVDELWTSRAIDVEIGDLILAPSTSEIEGKCLRYVMTIPKGVVFSATSQGIGRVEAGSWSAYVRVSRKEFVGRSIFRHLEDPEDCE